MLVVANRLRKYHEGYSELVYDFGHAIRMRDQSLVQAYLNLDKSLIKSRYEQGKTPLHLASQKGDVELMKLFIFSGIDVQATDASGNTPLHLSLRWNHLDAVKLLLSFGAEVNCRNWFGRTPLHEAETIYGFQILTAAGADVNAIDHYGNSIITDKNRFFKEKTLIFAIKQEYLNLSINEKLLADLYKTDLVFNIRLKNFLKDLKKELCLIQNICLEINGNNSLFDLVFSTVRCWSIQQDLENFFEKYGLDFIEQNFPHYGYLLFMK